MKTILTIVAVFGIILLSVGIWQIGKKLSYMFAYESLVEETINLKVKPECLVRK